jgi:hypothetical protein
MHCDNLKCTLQNTKCRSYAAQWVVYVLSPGAYAPGYKNIGTMCLASLETYRTILAIEGWDKHFAKLQKKFSLTLYLSKSKFVSLLQNFRVLVITLVNYLLKNL